MKILVILPRVPFPLEKGDKLRAYNHIKELSKNHEIILCALNDSKLHLKAISTLKQFCKSIYFVNLTKFSIFFNIVRAFFKGLPFQVGYFYSNKAQRKIKMIVKEHKPDRIFCQLIRTAEYVKSLTIPKTLDYQDVFSKGVQRRIESVHWLWKPIFKIEYKRLVKYEKEIFELFDHKTIISRPDRDLIEHPEKESIHIIPNGVDTEYFKPQEKLKTFDLLFTGNMGYPPNVNAAEYLVKEILPEIHKIKPNVNVMLAGANPHPNVKALESSHVRVTGWVDDLRDCYNQSRIFIAPMQIGTGLQNKLLEAMAMRLPCITSPLANEALKAKIEKEIIVCNKPDEYAKAIVSLLEDTDKMNQLATNGQKYVTDNHVWESITRKLEKIITE